jgi:hypothetical protein
MSVRSFLTALAPVIAREPFVFVDAMMATCIVEDNGRSGSVVVLRKPKASLALFPLSRWYLE